MKPIYLQQSKKFWMAPKLTIYIEVSCCNKVKMISNLLNQSAVKYSVFNGVNVMSSGEGKFEDCVVNIKRDLKKG